MSVRSIRDDNHFQSELSAAGNRLIVVDFTASWCGPCKHMAPHFEQFSKKYRQVIFLKVDVDECQETAAREGVSAMPTFIFYRNKNKIDQLRGADAVGLEAKIQGNIGPDDESPFMGKGYRLDAGSSKSAVSQAPTSDENEANEKFATEIVNLDSSQPATSIQIRLADGSRLTGRFNLTHTIADLRLFITTARPQYSEKPFSLLTTFPNKELVDTEQTISSAGIMNAAITQRLK